MKLRFDINAIADFDEISSISFFDLVENIGLASQAGTAIPCKMRDLRNLVYAGLLHNDETITVKEAGNLMEEYIKKHSFDRLMETLADSLLEATVFREEEKPTEEKKSSSSENG